MSIIQKRFSYLPFEYQEANKFTEQQQSVHWLRSEVPMSSDIVDWNSKLTDNEKNVIGNILKGFTQAEVVINDFWSQMVTKWFPKPEIVATAVTFASFEVIHQQAYALLNESLDLIDFQAFLEEPTIKNKLDFLLNTDGIELSDEERDILTEMNEKSPKSMKNKLQKIARSMAIFSAFTEGVNIFSSFAVLLSFQTRNLLKGVGQIVSYSIRDESIHSHGGCWIFNELCNEFPWLKSDLLKNDIYEAANLIIDLEDNFIDKVFELGAIKIVVNSIDVFLSKEHLKQFIRHRTNNKLLELNLDILFVDLNETLLREMTWFDSLSSGVEFADFFATRVTEYSKGHVDFNENDIFN